jgi:hypothetical protein
VGHSIAHATHLSPRDLWMRFRKISVLVTYACSSFTEHDEVQHYG